MKKLVFLAVAIALLVALGAVPASADGPNWSKICKALNDVGLSHGQCVSTAVHFAQACSCEGNNWPVCVCKSTLNFGLYFDNLGQCVSAIRTH